MLLSGWQIKPLNPISLIAIIKYKSMKINFNQEIKRYDGTSIVSEKKSFNVKKNDAGEWVSEPEVEYNDRTFLVDICKGALISNLVKRTVEETMQRFNLHKKIENGGEVVLSKEDLSTLKNLVNDKYDLLMAGQILVMLGEK